MTKQEKEVQKALGIGYIWEVCFPYRGTGMAKLYCVHNRINKVDAIEAAVPLLAAEEDIKRFALSKTTARILSSPAFWGYDD